MIRTGIQMMMVACSLLMLGLVFIAFGTAWAVLTLPTRLMQLMR